MPIIGLRRSDPPPMRPDDPIRDPLDFVSVVGLFKSVDDLGPQPDGEYVVYVSTGLAEDGMPESLERHEALRGKVNKDGLAVVSTMNESTVSSVKS